MPSVFSDDYVSAPFPADELQGGTFEGSIEERNSQIIHIEGICKKGDITRYYANGYRITKENGVITKLIIGSNRIPDGEIARHKDEVNALIGQLTKRNGLQHSLAAQNQRLAAQTVEAQIRYEQSQNREAQAEGQTVEAQMAAEKQAAQVRVQETQAQAQAMSAQTQAISSEAQIKYAQALASSAAGYSQSATGYANIVPDHGAATLDPNHSILEDILNANLATDPNHLTFRLSRKSFSINGVNQDKETTDRFIKKFVLGKDDTYMSYAYTKTDGQTSSSVTTTRK